MPNSKPIPQSSPYTADCSFIFGNLSFLAFCDYTLSWFSLHIADCSKLFFGLLCFCFNTYMSVCSRILLHTLFLSQCTSHCLGGPRHSQCSNYQCSHELQSCTSSPDQLINFRATYATEYQVFLLRCFSDTLISTYLAQKSFLPSNLLFFHFPSCHIYLIFQSRNLGSFSTSSFTSS